MNKQPIENARDVDLRLSKVAMHRAAQRARELAVRTGTFIIVSRGGVIEKITPKPTRAGDGVHEPEIGYGDKA